MNEVCWGNSLFTFNRETLYSKKWYTSGILKLGDIYDCNTHEILQDKIKEIFQEDTTYIFMLSKIIKAISKYKFLPLVRVVNLFSCTSGYQHQILGNDRINYLKILWEEGEMFIFLVQEILDDFILTPPPAFYSWKVRVFTLTLSWLLLRIVKFR